VKLIRLHLTNFKGIREFTLDAQGHNVDVFGDNATGKTTLFDAFMWLLFDKDSANRKDFEIKTLGPDGQPIHGLNHEVEAVIEIDGQAVTLRKVFYEKWQKKRGSAEKVFTGHTTDYYIDGVPVKKAVYEGRMAEIADESIFKLLTSPTYFNEQLHWQKRREILLQVCGDVSDEEVISSDHSLAKLPEILQGRKLEDHRKIIMARRAEINKELEKIPVRIDEVEHSLPRVEDVDPQALADDITKLRTELQAKQQELVRLESGGEIAEKTRRLREVEAEVLELQRMNRERVDTAIEQERKKARALQDESDKLQADIRSWQRRIEANDREIDRLTTEMDRLRQEWYRVNEQQFAFDQAEVCPTCGQPIPAEQLEEARAKALADFNRAKAEKLEEISARGREAKARVQELQADNAAAQGQVNKSQQTIAGLERERAQVERRIAQLRDENALTMKEDEALAAKVREVDTLRAEIEALKAGGANTRAAVAREIELLDDAIRALEQEAARVEARKHGLVRIEELKAQERQLAAEYERLEGELYLTEQFIRTKVLLLEDKINSRFKLARFKLFDVQVNGGVVECFETTYQGVPYSSGLNNAARINVGLDIINTLAEHYGFAPPIWIDNAEAVTQLIPTKGQMIRLIVSEDDKSLRVELPKENTNKEVA